jgi:cell wall-associated NlpC family hydrolase
MGTLIKRAASLLAVLALAVSVTAGFAAPAQALAGCKTSFASTATIKKGATGARVKAAQCLLTKSGYPVKADGSFSGRDAAKTRKFQARHDVKRTGQVNDTTWKTLIRNVKNKQHATAKRSGAAGAKGSSTGRKALAFAKRQVGDRYRFGGNGPNAWDCSGLTRGAWKHAGKKLARTAAAQYRQGKKVSRSNLRRGDLVFFYGGPSHVGIYAGNGKIIHASRPGKPVDYIKMKFIPYKGARRPA